MHLAHASIQDIIETQELAVKQMQEISNSQGNEKYQKRPYQVTTALQSAADEIGWQDALEVYKGEGGSRTRTERNRGEGKLRSELLKKLAQHPVGSEEIPLVRSMAVDEVKLNFYCCQTSQ